MADGRDSATLSEGEPPSLATSTTSERDSDTINALAKPETCHRKKLGSEECVTPPFNAAHLGTPATCAASLGSPAESPSDPAMSPPSADDTDEIANNNNFSTSSGDGGPPQPVERQDTTSSVGSTGSAGSGGSLSFSTQLKNGRPFVVNQDLQGAHHSGETVKRLSDNMTKIALEVIRLESSQSSPSLDTFNEQQAEKSFITSKNVDKNVK